MIEYIFASEFDFEKGTNLKCYYPDMPKKLNQTFLTSFMIPEGAHKRDSDMTYFKIKLQPQWSEELVDCIRHEFNTRKPMVSLYQKKTSWTPFNKSDHSKEYFEASLLERYIHIQDAKGQNCFNFQITQIQQYSIVFEQFISFTINDEVYGLEFLDAKHTNTLDFFISLFLEKDKPMLVKESKERFFYFYNVMKTSKAKNSKRGPIVRSIAICSTTINQFDLLTSKLVPYLDFFVDMPNEPHKDDFNSLRQILFSAYQAINNEIRQYKLSHIYKSPVELNYSNEVQIKTDASYSKVHKTNKRKSSLADLISIFKHKVMVIYLALLFGYRILFISQDKSCQEICRCINSCRYLISPLNIASKMFYYEHLSDISFIKVESYIAGVSNLIFKTKRDWWDICCDLDDGTILDNVGIIPINQENKSTEVKMFEIDQEFIEQILKRIKDDCISDEQLKESFCSYTKNFINFATNSANSIDYLREDKALLEAFENRSNIWKKTYTYTLYEENLLQRREVFKVIFGEKYLDVLTALNNFAEKKAFNDIDLFKDYAALLENLDDSDKFHYFLKQLVAKKGEITILASGLFSSNEDIRMKAVQLLIMFEKYHYKKFLHSSLNYYIISVLETLGNT